MKIDNKLRNPRILKIKLKKYQQEYIILHENNLSDFREPS